MIKINEPQLPWLQTVIIYHTGLDVKMEVTQCAGRISANTRHHHMYIYTHVRGADCSFIPRSPLLPRNIFTYDRHLTQRSYVNTLCRREVLGTRLRTVYIFLYMYMYMYTHKGMSIGNHTCTCSYMYMQIYTCIKT